jgi:hypothetical protein
VYSVAQLGPNPFRHWKKKKELLGNQKDEGRQLKGESLGLKLKTGIGKFKALH